MFIATGFPGVEGRILSLTFDAGTCPLYGNHEMEPAAIATGLGSGRVYLKEQSFHAFEEADSGVAQHFSRCDSNSVNRRIYRESSHIQLTSHVFPPSDEKDCSIRDDLGEMLSQT